ncbi:hypothetical protein RHSIM_Rhsim10G0047100 [Rhododendron simsii]|uniref:Uncharacterized protein n=1 Tax=Rhododendron simsii TaxID=118357 RepID=A0A834LDF6_RHOSS|nr:hypothetical protein RHSIM_Rhsim10G0047100 [Rhododendron simsii]
MEFFNPRRHPHFVYQHCLPPPPRQISIAVVSLNPTRRSVSDLKDIGTNAGVLSGQLYSADRMLPPLDGPCSMAMRGRRRRHRPELKKSSDNCWDGALIETLGNNRDLQNPDEFEGLKRGGGIEEKCRSLVTLSLDRSVYTGDIETMPPLLCCCSISFDCSTNLSFLMRASDILIQAVALYTVTMWNFASNCIAGNTRLKNEPTKRTEVPWNAQTMKLLRILAGRRVSSARYAGNPST